MLDDALTTDRERDAVELLARLFERRAGHPLYDDCMAIEWMDDQIMAYIRKHGPFEDQLRELK